MTGVRVGLGVMGGEGLLGGIGVWSHSVEAMETQCGIRDKVS